MPPELVLPEAPPELPPAVLLVPPLPVVAPPEPLPPVLVVPPVDEVPRSGALQPMRADSAVAARPRTKTANRLFLIGKPPTFVFARCWFLSK
jgi:hypothetical protein